MKAVNKLDMSFITMSWQHFIGTCDLVAWSRHIAPRKADRLAVGWVAGEGAYFCLSGLSSPLLPSVGNA